MDIGRLRGLLEMLRMDVVKATDAARNLSSLSSAEENLQELESFRARMGELSSRVWEIMEMIVDPQFPPGLFETDTGQRKARTADYGQMEQEV